MFAYVIIIAFLLSVTLDKFSVAVVWFVIVITLLMLFFLYTENGGNVEQVSG